MAIPVDSLPLEFATRAMNKHSQTLILLNLREIAGLLYIVCEPHPGLEPLLKPNPPKPPKGKTRVQFDNSLL